MKARAVNRGALLAATVALMFAGTAMTMVPSAGAAAHQVKCMGGNSCKGQSACKSFKHSCKGLNACKGQGFVMTSSVKACKAKGGRVAK